MTKIQIIKKVLGTRFAKHGFEFLGSLRRGLWEFQRIVEDDVNQNIRLFINPHDSHNIYMEIYTKYYGIERAKTFANEPKYTDTYKENWDFKDDDEFIEVLEEIGDIIEKYGLKRLAEMSIPKYKYKPTAEMYRKLYDEHDELSAKFRKDNNIKEDITFKESIDIIVNILENEKGEKIYDDVTKTKLLEMAAFYGERMILRYYGEWDWFEPTKLCHVENMKINASGADVLFEIVQAWEKGNTEIIVFGYNHMIKSEQYNIYLRGKSVPPKINYDY